MRCTAVAGRQQCIRERNHPGDHHMGARDGLFDIACDSCGHPVLEIGRFRHPDCPPPARTAELIHKIRTDMEIRHANHQPTP